MKRRILGMLTLCLLAQWSVAQAPKWVEKAKRAVFSIVTYGNDDKILSTGNGFFVSEEGIALSDYTLFKGAQRAVAISSDGTQMPIESILGADEMYDVIKFKVAISGKKAVALPVATTSPTNNEEIYLLPYSTQKERNFAAGKVQGADKISGNYAYYTLNLPLKDKMVSCPVMNANGEVFGLAQKSSGQDTVTICYAMDARYAMSQNISALSFNSTTLKNIGIKKALPDTEEQALVFLFMASSQFSPEEYRSILDDFIQQYPNCADGYMRRATQQLYLSQDDASMKQVTTDMDKAVSIATKKDDIYYNRAKMIYSYMLTAPQPTYGDWSFDKALTEIKQAIEINPLPIYWQAAGDIQFAREDYPAALECYTKVNESELASAVSFFSTAKTKERMGAPAEEVLQLMDSCVAHFNPPYMEEAAPYLLERAQARVNANQARTALLDYDAYFKAINGKVNDLFYYYREQAALKAKQYQRALDDIAKAIELNPEDVTYRAEQAVVNIRVGRNEEAIRILEEAIQMKADYAEAYRLLGIAQLQMKKNKEACSSFSKAKELGDPNVDELIQKHCK